MKVYTLDEFNTLPLADQYQYFSLCDQGGGVIIPFNSNKVSGSTRLREIEKRLLSAGCRNGYYLIKGKNSPVRNAMSDDFTLYKGEKLAENATPAAPPAPVAYSPEVLSYESALKLQVEVEKLKLENASLRKQVAELENELSTAQEENLGENANSDLWTNAKSFLSELVAMGAPLLDKHFELKEKALSLKAMQLQSYRPAQTKAPQANPTQAQKATIEDKIMTFKSDPETYNKLAEVYNTALDQESFLKDLNELDPELAKLFM